MGRLSISKSIKVLPGVRVRYSLSSGFKVVLGGRGITYSIPLKLPPHIEDKLTSALKGTKPTPTDLVEDLPINLVPINGPTPSQEDSLAPTTKHKSRSRKPKP